MLIDSWVDRITDSSSGDLTDEERKMISARTLRKQKKKVGWCPGGRLHLTQRERVRGAIRPRSLVHRMLAIGTHKLPNSTIPTRPP